MPADRATPAGERERKPLIFRRSLGWWLWALVGIGVGAIAIKVLGVEAMLAGMFGAAFANDMEADNA